MDSSDTFRLKATIVDHVAIQVQRAGRPGRLQRHRAAKPLVGHLAGHVHLNRNAQCQPLRRRAQRPQPVKLLLAALLSTLHEDRKRPRPGGRHAAPGPHYPSWGSETLRRARDFLRHRPLITPHGDPKPSGAPATFFASPTHYPSWGSETGRRQRGEPDARLHLITPHGDRKRVGINLRHAAASTHYPSWGSETFVDGTFHRFPQLLITPHGDRKPPGCRPSL